MTREKRLYKRHEHDVVTKWPCDKSHQKATPN